MQVTTATSDALQKYLDLASDQMKLTAENMANVDTPGYKYAILILLPRSLQTAV